MTMHWKNTTDHYGSLSIFMHWLMLLLLVAIYACIELRELYPKGSDLREALKQWHFMLGLTVLALVWLRLALRMIGTSPEIRPAAGKWQHRLAVVVHLALYIFMIAMPLLGWLLLSAEGTPVPFFGLELPALIGTDAAVADSVGALHEAIGTAGYYLVGLHAIAALFHNYVLRDNALHLMLPLRPRGRRDRDSLHSIGKLQ